VHEDGFFMLQKEAQQTVTFSYSYGFFTVLSAYLIFTIFNTVSHPIPNIVLRRNILLPVFGGVSLNLITHLFF